MALSGDRFTDMAVRGLRSFPVLASTVIYEGSQVAVDATGWARPARDFGTTNSTDKVVGVASARVDNSAGANGALYVTVRCDEIGYFANSTSGDLIARKDIGSSCYAVDDQQVALTATGTGGSNSRARSGKIHDVRSDGQVGVWFDQ